MKIAALFAVLLALAGPASAKKDPLEDRFGKADALIEKGSYSEARAELDEILLALKIDDPRMVRYHERTGAAWLREGKVRDARASFTAALKASQRQGISDQWAARAYAGLGLCLRRENKDKYALRFFKRALELGPDEGTRLFIEDQVAELEGAPPRALN